MKLKDAREAFYESSESLSETTRKLLFSGIATIWLLHEGEKGAQPIPYSPELFRPLGLFIVGLVLDLTQYLYKTLAWWRFYSTRHRRRVADDADIAAPRFINVPAFALFYGKVIACGFGYALLITYVAKHL